MITLSTISWGFFSLIAILLNSYILGALGVFMMNFMDSLDGEYARMTGQKSDFGAFFDGLADFISINLVFIALAYKYPLFGFYAMLMHNIDRMQDSRILLSLISKGERVSVRKSWLSYFTGACAERSFLSLSLLSLKLLLPFLIVYYSFVGLRILTHLLRIRKKLS